MKESLSNFDRYYITPAIISSIQHRSECVPYYGAFYSTDVEDWCLSTAYLPIFTAPMACIVNESNYLEFDKEGIIPIIPRTVSFEKRLELMKKMVWIAVGLDEFKKIIEFDTLTDETYICLDIANGHMEQALDLCEKSKKKFGDKLILMFGNIANPETYMEYARIGIDYCRVGIGDGQACLTNTLTGIGQDMPTMIHLLNEYKVRAQYKYHHQPKVIIDGGMSSIRDMIIALGIGADYIMCGKIFAQTYEACGEVIYKFKETTKTYMGFVSDNLHDDYHYEEDEEMYLEPIERSIFESKQWLHVPGRMYYGMSTERAQKEMGNSKIKPAEGKEFWVPIEYTLRDWVKQFVAAISSTMSYCDKKLLTDFVGNVEIHKYQ